MGIADRAKQRLQQIQASLAPTPPIQQAVQALQATFPASQLSLDHTILTRFGTSWGSFVPPAPPSIVVYAESTADVVSVVRIAKTYTIVLIPVGGRTSLEGQFLPPACCELRIRADSSGKERDGSPPVALETGARPTIHLSLERMDKVLAVHQSDFQAVVEPGVGWQSLNEHLEEAGVPLFFPIDPAPGAQFGGMVGVGGSGTNAVGYGTMRAEWIQGMEVVLMSGEVINTRGKSRSRKSSTGWDVGRLFMGSEGTLGIITKLIVRLTPVTPLRVAHTSFSTISEAVNAVVAIVEAGLAPTSLELLDGTSIRAMNLAEILPEPIPAQPTVFMRFTHSVPEAIEAALKKVADIVAVRGGRTLHIAKDEKEGDRIWKARKNQYWSQQLLVDGECQTLLTDVCVPISRLAEFVEISEGYIKESGLLAPLVAHSGDGNCHYSVLYKAIPGVTGSPPEVIDLASKLSKLAIRLEGTCAGEHGIGTKKRQYLKEELGSGTLGVMRAIKNLMDPEGLLNPGKVLYEHEEDEP